MFFLSCITTQHHHDLLFLPPPTLNYCRCPPRSFTEKYSPYQHTIVLFIIYFCISTTLLSLLHLSKFTNNLIGFHFSKKQISPFSKSYLKIKVSSYVVQIKGRVLSYLIVLITSRKWKMFYLMIPSSHLQALLTLVIFLKWEIR